MKPFVPVYVPVGVPTFHMESAGAREGILFSRESAGGKP